MSNHSELLHRLREEIRQVETAGRAALYDQHVISGGVAALDQLLPEGGYAPGSLVEWLAPVAGCGAELLGLLLARSAAAGSAVLGTATGSLAPAHGAASGATHGATRRESTARSSGGRDSKAREPGVIVIADPRRDFYAPAAVRLGLRPDQLILLQHPREEELYWAIEQALRCPAIAAVYAAADLSSTTRQSFLGSNLDQRWLRRFQLAAEQGGGLGIFVRPVRVAGRPTWADLQWRVAIDPTSLHSHESTTCPAKMRLHEAHVPLQVELLRCRGQTSGHAVALQLNLQTGEAHRRQVSLPPLPCSPRKLSAG
jgi:protein ImuA